MKHNTFCKIKCDHHCLFRKSMTTAVPRQRSSFDRPMAQRNQLYHNFATQTARLDGRYLENDTRKTTA